MHILQSCVSLERYTLATSNRGGCHRRCCCSNDSEVKPLGHATREILSGFIGRAVIKRLMKPKPKKMNTISFPYEHQNEIIKTVSPQSVLYTAILFVVKLHSFKPSSLAFLFQSSFTLLRHACKVCYIDNLSLLEFKWRHALETIETVLRKYVHRGSQQTI